MQNKLKKLAIFLLVALMAIIVIGCDNSNTTTELQSTVGITTLQTTLEQTTVQTTTEDVTTIQTTTEDVTTQQTTTTQNSAYIGIEVTDITQTEYNLGEVFNSNTITVSLVRGTEERVSLNSGIYSLSGFDSSVVGEQTLTVSYVSFTTTFTVTIIDPNPDPDPNTDLVITMSYYFSAQDLDGSALFDELTSIINNGFTGVSYDAAKYALGESDKDPNNANNIILVYLGTSIDAYNPDGSWTYPAWNREHVWPQSALAGAFMSDLQNLKPSDVNTNSSRGNKYFDNYMSSTTWEPRDEVKGDIARIMLYMITKYTQLSLVDSVPNIGNGEMGKFSVLLEWHEQDPVDDFERNRNNVIYSYQHNRNPYIDYPEFVEMIWGE
ncbi:MAG: endonuclease [Tenericutes bacterium]|nr:endonuclease [Mycoplasmatota bacterium]